VIGDAAHEAGGRHTAGESVALDQHRPRAGAGGGYCCAEAADSRTSHDDVNVIQHWHFPSGSDERVHTEPSVANSA